MTKSLYNCLNNTCIVTLIANINPNDYCHEETLMSLQYAEKSRNIEIKDKNARFSNLNSTQFNGMMNGMDDHGNINYEKMIQKMADEINELRAKIDSNTRENRSKVDKLKNLMGVEIDLDKITANPNGRGIDHSNSS